MFLRPLFINIHIQHSRCDLAIRKIEVYSSVIFEQYDRRGRCSIRIGLLGVRWGSALSPGLVHGAGFKPRSSTSRKTVLSTEILGAPKAIYSRVLTIHFYHG